MSLMDVISLQNLSYRTLQELATEEGFNASGKEEIFGCIFGRDSAITILKILRTLKKNKTSENLKQEMLLKVERALLTLISLQGKEFNIESGEEPGKFIHEYRKEKFEHLAGANPPWYIYSDGKLRNYDSLDATPLMLIAIFRYFQISKNKNFLKIALPAVLRGIEWMEKLADKDNDGLVEYELSPLRKYGGLAVQSWTDSRESILRKDGSMPKYPIAPVEVQGYTWLAYRLWGKYFKSPKLLARALKMKICFNQKFWMKENGKFYPVQALDGDKRQIKNVTGNPLLLLWASDVTGTMVESIMERRYIKNLVKRAMEPDLFDPEAGIRTLSTRSAIFNGGINSYHNGSFWPKVNGMAWEGLELWGYKKEAEKLKEASLKPLDFFGTPIELYIHNTGEQYREFESNGQKGCRTQAWSAAVMWDMTTVEKNWWETFFEIKTDFQKIFSGWKQKLKF